MLGSAGMPSQAQTANRIVQRLDPAHVQLLPNHHPRWANPSNSAGQVPPDSNLEHMTLVLARSPEREAAFEKLLAEQQDPASPNFHQWLTPAEIGNRYGLSDADIDTVSSWLQSQGMHVNWVAPSRIFIEFGGLAADVSQAFKTELNNYQVNGAMRFSVASDPMIPVALSPVIKAVRGLYTIDEQPQHSEATMGSDSPLMTTQGGQHYITPNDFFNIYSLPSGIRGTGVTIGIVGRSRTNPADFSDFKSLIGSSFSNPTEIVPTAYGGVDPGPAYTAPPSGNVSVGEQGEATLDVVRAGSVAPGAQLMLVVASPASGGIDADAQYLVNTTPVPVQVMTISYGACESAAGPTGVSYWDSLFQQAAAEGISSFVSSGDSGAAGCDSAFTTPPASPQAISPNYICSSSYVTCVGGTEFNDASGSYWNAYSPGTFTSATGYIPEGAWNESWNGTTSTVAGSGGGVSSVIATPSWQKGVPGVPAANAGRYSPDVSFSASGHDGYFMCFAAGGGSCVSTNGSYGFMIFAGTSASAPSMAGIAALLDQNMAGAQGNLNPGLYQMGLETPSAFHDVTPASSGVTSCDINTPSMCNNSIPGPSGVSGGQSGYAVGTGYDEVTGLGSLNAGVFVNSYGSSTKIVTPQITIGSAVHPVNQSIVISVIVSGTSSYAPAPTGSIVLTAGSYTSAPTPYSSTGFYVVIPVGTLTMGDYTVTVTYTPDAASASIYTAATGIGQLTVSSPQYISPVMVLSPAAWTVLNSAPVTLPVSVRGGAGNSIPTGTVSLVFGTYTSSPIALVAGNGSIPDGEASFTIPTSALFIGADTFTVTYTPDTSGSSLFVTNSASGAFTVVGGKITPSVTVVPSSTSITSAQTLSVSIGVGSNVITSPSGTVTLTSGGYTSGPMTLLPSGGGSTINLPAGALAIGTDTLTASYSGDSLFVPASGSASVVVSQAPPPSFTLSGTSVTVRAGSTAGDASTVTLTPSGGFTGSILLTAVVTSMPTGAQNPPALSFGTTTPVNITNSTPRTATLIVTTTAATTGTLMNSKRRGDPWQITGGTVLACVLIFLFPARSSRWRAMLGMFALLVALSGGVLACGGNSAGGVVTHGNAGTMAGAYTITVTGTSGATATTCTVSLTVQ